MRTYLADIIPKIQRYSKQLDDLTSTISQKGQQSSNQQEQARQFKVGQFTVRIK